MTALFKVLLKWLVGWWAFGLTSPTWYLVIAGVIAMVAVAALEWVAKDPNKVGARFITGVLLGLVWPVTLSATALLLFLTPLALAGGALWKWQVLNAKARHTVATVLHERAEANRQLKAGDDFGKPTPESLSMVERILRMEMF